MSLSGLRRWEYVGGIQLWDKRMVDVYEAPLTGKIKLIDGIDQVEYTTIELEWLLNNVQCEIVGWRERELRQVWV